MDGIKILLAIYGLLQVAWGYSFDKNWTDQGQNGVVTSESAICSRAGLSMFKKGGNAVDAIVANIFCVGVVGCHNSGISGGGFALVRMPNNTFEAIDFREEAPAAAFTKMFDGNNRGSMVGGNATAVPDQIRGLDYLLKKYGKLSWSTVIEPSIEVANTGFPVPSDMAFGIGYALGISPPTGPDNKTFFQNSAWSPDFAPNGTVVGYQDHITRKRYANALRNISTGGADSFYNGYIADTMINTVKKEKGIMTKKDLQSYDIKTRNFLQSKYNGYTLTTSTMPSSGAVVLNVLGILDLYPDFFTGPKTVNLSTHRMVEAIKFGYGYRNMFGDPDFNTQNLTGLEEEMVAPGNLERLRGKINDSSTNPATSWYDPAHVWAPESYVKAPSSQLTKAVGTSAMSAADKSGLTISVTTTVNLPFGNQVMVPETGIILNSQMDDFAQPFTEGKVGFPVSPNNFIQPGKRPQSSISPIIVTHPNGTVAFITGAAGGRHIPSAVIQVLVAALRRNESPFNALNTSRLHHQLFPNQVEVLPTFDNTTVDSLKSRNHTVVRVEGLQSMAQAIRRLANGTFWAASEPAQLQSGGYAL